MADLNNEGTMSETREEYMSLVLMGLIQLMIVQCRSTGMGSAGDVVRLIFSELATFDVVMQLKCVNSGGVEPQSARCYMAN